MNLQFWHDHWEQNNIFFHQQTVNPYLEKYVDNFPSGKVFVPLCGKSKDMLWLKAKGHEVIGVDVSPIACRNFFEESNLNYNHSVKNEFQCFYGDGITLWCGDFFSMDVKDLLGVKSVYDRAALIALPAKTRQMYALKLKELIPSSWWMLLITLDFPPEKRQGPPFPVCEQEVRTLYKGSNIKVVEEVREVPTRWPELPSITDRIYEVVNGGI